MKRLPSPFSKAMVCACEDVTAGDLEECLALGLGDLESVKRYTGLGTGWCQGKSCIAPAARWLADRGAEPAGPFTARPPNRPTSFASLAGLDLEVLGPPGPGVPPEVAEGPPRPGRPLPERADVVIVGGGIMGLALAWELARRGVSDVVVLEAGYLCAGASGRNGGGVRMQWTTPTNIRLARRSIEMMRGFAEQLHFNVWLRRGGYLFLALDLESARRAERAAEIQRRHGVRTELVGADRCQSLVPALDVDRVVLGAYHPDDGTIFPWGFLYGYAAEAERLGARIETFTRVTGLETAAGRVTHVVTDRGRIRAQRVVNAAGAWSPMIARLAGASLPNQPLRHEILVSEPLKPFLEPLVAVLGSGLYVSQSMRGELVGGMGDPDEPVGLHQTATARFLGRFSRALVELMPSLGAVQVVRQWAGCYDVTPDNSPILGPTPGLENFMQMSGFVGHGFMMAPAVAEAYALWLTGGAKDEIFDRFAVSRFAEGRMERETLIIG